MRVPLIWAGAAVSAGALHGAVGDPVFVGWKFHDLEGGQILGKPLLISQ
jgi:hypothetical protein